MSTGPIRRYAIIFYRSAFDDEDFSTVDEAVANTSGFESAELSVWIDHPEDDDLRTRVAATEKEMARFYTLVSQMRKKKPSGKK